MELQKINELLEKYWNGNTSLEEEQMLTQYFRDNEVPARLKGVAALFCQFEAGRQTEVPDKDFDDQVLQKISQVEPAKVRSLPQRMLPQRQPLHGQLWLKIAAILLIFLTAGLLWLNQADRELPVAEQTETTQDTYQDPQQAYEQTRQALLLVSSLMNEGTQHLEELEAFSEAQETIKTEKQ